LFGIFKNAMSEQIAPGRGRGRPSREEVYLRLETQVRELWDRMGGLPSPLEAADIWRGIWFEEAHHSTAIEGNTLVLKQVEKLLDEGRAVGNKELREYMEVRGYATAAEWVYGQAISPTRLSRPEDVLTLAEVREIHHTAMTPVWDVAPHPDATAREAPGSYREHEIHPFPGGMIPVSWPLIPAEMETWIDDVNALDTSQVAFPEDLGQLHVRFEQIHPFLDGNGRTGRLVVNLILVRLGYPPAIIYKRDRADYLRALQRADAGEPGQLGEMLARAILDNLYRFVVPAVAGPARLVPLAALETPDMKASALRAAAARGRLQATRGPDGQWRSSRNWVDEYKAIRYRRG
jgi:fido (protein-threonine AMPylation protein)